MGDGNRVGVYVVRGVAEVVIVAVKVGERVNEGVTVFAAVDVFVGDGTLVSVKVLEIRCWIGVLVCVVA